MVEQLKGGGGTARGGGDVVQLLSHGATLPLAAAVRSCCHHLAVPVLQVHRPFDTVPERGEAQAEMTPESRFLYPIFLFNSIELNLKRGCS